MATPENEVVVEETVVDKTQQTEKQSANKKEKAKKEKKNKKPKEHKVGKIKETVSELKKVSWPSFGKVVKQTLVVIGMVLFFTLVLFAIDQLLGLGYKTIIDWISKTTTGA